MNNSPENFFFSARPTPSLLHMFVTSGHTHPLLRRLCISFKRVRLDELWSTREETMGKYKLRHSERHGPCSADSLLATGSRKHH
jgi:hypothetical protein